MNDPTSAGVGQEPGIDPGEPAPLDPFASMTLAQLEALASRFGAAVRTIHDARELLGGTATSVAGGSVGRGSAIARPVAPLSAPPFPCAMCGRQAPEQWGETCRAEECPECGNHLPSTSTLKVALPPGAIMTNKGPRMLTDAERAAKMSQPAFGPDGEPA